MPLGWQYFFLNMFFITIILLIIGVWVYAKWQILGPKFHAKRHKFIASFKSRFDKTQPKIKRGAVIDDSGFKENLDQEEQKALSAQELLAIQTQRHIREREIAKLEQELQKKEDEKIKKLETKKKEKEIKEKEKEISKQLKSEKKSKKGKK